MVVAEDDHAVALDRRGDEVAADQDGPIAAAGAELELDQVGEVLAGLEIIRRRDVMILLEVLERDGFVVSLDLAIELCLGLEGLVQRSEDGVAITHGRSPGSQSS